MAKSIQFNTKDAKAFRDTMAKYHVATNKIVDIMNRRSDDMKSVKAIYENNLEDLYAIETGTYDGHRDADDIRKDTSEMKARMERIQKDYESAKAKAEKNTATAIKLVKNGDALYKAYTAMVSAHFDDESAMAFAECVAQFFKDNGLADATAENSLRFARAIGGRKNTAKKAYKEKRLVSAIPEKQFIAVFLGNLADILVESEIISPAKFDYVPVSLREKKK